MKPQIPKTVAGLYTDLSADYDQWFSAPWPEPALRHGGALDRLIRAEGFDPPATVLDLTCGMGTQTIGLSLLGYDLTAMDISAGQLARAKAEASKLQPGNEIAWLEGDAARADELASVGAYDVVISCENSLPLLGSPRRMRRAVRAAYRLLKPGGLFIVSQRDHTDLRARKPYLVDSGALGNGGRAGCWIETARWSWDGSRYRSNIVFVFTAPDHSQRLYPFPWLYAVRQDEFLKMLKREKFTQARFLASGADLGFSCPLFLARKRAKDDPGI